MKTARATLPLIAVLAACGQGTGRDPPTPDETPAVRDSAAAPAAPTTPENAEWRLVALGGRPARVAEGNDAPSLRLDPAGKRAGGNTGCNLYSGSYQLAGDSLRFGPMISTKRACVDPEMNRQETVFLGALEATTMWRIAGDTLHLADGGGKLARFQRH